MRLPCLLCLQSRGSSHSLALLAWCLTLSWGLYCVSQTKGIHVKHFKWSWRSSHVVWGKLRTHFPRLITHQQFPLKTSSCHVASYSFLKGWECLVSQVLHNWFFVTSLQAPHNLAILLLGCGNSGHLSLWGVSQNRLRSPILISCLHNRIFIILLCIRYLSKDSLERREEKGQSGSVKDTGFGALNQLNRVFSEPHQNLVVLTCTGSFSSFLTVTASSFLLLGFAWHFLKTSLLNFMNPFHFPLGESSAYWSSSFSCFLNLGFQSVFGNTILEKEATKTMFCNSIYLVNAACMLDQSFGDWQCIKPIQGFEQSCSKESGLTF